MRKNGNATIARNDERESSVQKLNGINGIGRKTAEALYEVGIHDYVDLTQFAEKYTAEDISEELSRHGVKLPPAFIHKGDWIRHAKELSQIEKSLRAQRDAQFTVSFDIQNDEHGKPILYTIVYDDKNAGKEEEFIGNEIAPWATWMIEHASLPFTVELVASQSRDTAEIQPEAAEPALPRPGTPPDARLEFDDVRLSVIEEQAKIPLKRLMAEIGFHLSGPDSNVLASQGIPYQIEIFTIDLDRGTPNRLVVREGRLQQDQFEYSDQLEFAIPDVGRFEYYSLVRLLPYGNLSAYHWGPTMKVNP